MPAKGWTRLSAETIEDICRRYDPDNGVNTRTLADEFGLNQVTVCRYLKRNGVKTKQRSSERIRIERTGKFTAPLTQKQIDDMKYLYWTLGRSFEGVAEGMITLHGGHWTRGQVRHYFIREKIPTRGRSEAQVTRGIKQRASKSHRAHLTPEQIDDMKYMYWDLLRSFDGVAQGMAKLYGGHWTGPQVRYYFYREGIPIRTRAQAQVARGVKQRAGFLQGSVYA